MSAEHFPTPDPDKTIRGVRCEAWVRDGVAYLTTSDPRFYAVQPDGTRVRPGIWNTFEPTNERSANLNPANFNRVVRALRDAGAVDIPDEVPEIERRIDRRGLTLRTPLVLIDGVHYVPKR